RLASVTGIGEPEFRPQAHTWPDVVLEESVDQQVAVELIVDGHERTDFEADRLGSRVRLTLATILGGRVRRRQTTEADEQQSDEEFAHRRPPVEIQEP